MCNKEAERALRNAEFTHALLTGTDDEVIAAAVKLAEALKHIESNE
jgi:hypothetical protein